MKMSLGDFADAISTRVWESAGRANWRPFREAREFAQTLGLSSHVEWWKWTTGRLRRANLPEMPPDVPTGPDRVYSDDWKDWADWLGHSRRIGGWRSFNAARKYPRNLQLKSRKEWIALTKDRAITNLHRPPDDIPTEPGNVYEEWIG